MEINHQAIVTELWDKIRNAIDGKIASAAGHLAEVIQVADQKIAEAASHAAAALEAKEGAVEAGGDKAPLEHEHVSADITDTTTQAGTLSDANKVMATNGSGRFVYNRVSTDPNELVNRKFVTDQAALRVPTSDVTTTPEEGKIPRWVDGEHLYVGPNPTDQGHAASKAYVDRVTTKIEVVSSLPTNADLTTVYLVRE